MAGRLCCCKDSNNSKVKIYLTYARCQLAHGQLSAWGDGRNRADYRDVFAQIRSGEAFLKMLLFKVLHLYKEI